MQTEQELENTQEMNESANDPYGEADLKQRVGVAARVAAEAGEFKTLAFEKVLDRLLGAPLTVVAEGVPQITPDVEATEKPARRTAKRAPKAPAAPALDRIKPLLAVAGETVAEWSEKIAKAPKKCKHHGVLIFARENGVDGLTLPEIRHVLTNMMRDGIADGTLRGNLSNAPPTEISRTPNEQGDTIYRVLRAGEESFKKALADVAAGKGE